MVFGQNLNILTSTKSIPFVVRTLNCWNLSPQDMVKFGFSTREYVLLNERSKDDESDEEETAGKTD